MCAADFAIGPSAEVVIVGKPRSSDTEAMIEALRAAFVPNKVVLFRATDDNNDEIDSITGFTNTLKSIDGNATAYVCREQKCEMPTTDLNEMLRLLGAK